MEFIETASGRHIFFDINATTIYRSDICAALGVDAIAALVNFLERELNRALVRRAQLSAEAGGRAAPALTSS